jgi:two-component system catabolic regulation response regulator CreB
VRTRRVTIIEDDENTAGLLAFILRREGFAPEIVRDGRAAIEHVRDATPPAAVVLDQMLPYHDAHAVASAMRADRRWSAVPILLLRSASPAGWDPLRDGALVDVSVSKPFDPFALVAQVDLLAREAA